MTSQTPLDSALADAARALEAGDAVGAAEAMERVVRACDEARAAGVPLGADTLAEARRLFDRCTAAAERLRARLGGELAQAGLGRRAVAAYRSR